MFQHDEIKENNLAVIQLSIDHNIIIDRLKAYDESAFKDLFNIYKDLVFSVCFRMTNNKNEAEDLTQDVFLKIYSSRHTYRSESKLSTWIYRIAVNTCINHRKRMKWRRFLSLDFLFEEYPDSKFQVSDKEYNVRDKIEKSEQAHILHQAIDTLTKNQKSAVNLRYFEGLSYEEIAEIMDTTVSSVESLLHRAKKNLSMKLIEFL